MHVILTIGHSTHPLDHFLWMLDRHRVTAVADVRSSPYSRHNPQFNREALTGSLKAAGISYAFLGRELGARSDDPADYDGDRVVYERLAASNRFHHGLKRVLTGAQSHRIALMCAEKDPITCHRAILVAPRLIEAGVSIEHVLPDGAIETHEDAIERLIRQLDLATTDMFGPQGDTIQRAYQEQELRIAYVRPAKDQA